MCHTQVGSRRRRVSAPRRLSAGRPPGGEGLPRSGSTAVLEARLPSAEACEARGGRPEAAGLSRCMTITGCVRVPGCGCSARFFLGREKHHGSVADMITRTNITTKALILGHHLNFKISGDHKIFSVHVKPGKTWGATPFYNCNDLKLTVQTWGSVIY